MMFKKGIEYQVIKMTKKGTKELVIKKARKVT